MVLISSSPAMAFFMYTKEWDIKSTMEDKVAPSSNSRKKKRIKAENVLQDQETGKPGRWIITSEARKDPKPQINLF